MKRPAYTLQCNTDRFCRSNAPTMPTGDIQACIMTTRLQWWNGDRSRLAVAVYREELAHRRLYARDYWSR